MPSWIDGLGHNLARLLQPKEHDAATIIANAWRRHVAVGRLVRARAAASRVHVAVHAALAEAELRQRRSVYLAAVTLQKWVRGFIDRAWVRMVLEEVENLAQALEVQAEERARQRINPIHKVKRAFSFKRKQLRASMGGGGRSHCTAADEGGSEPSMSAAAVRDNISSLLAHGGHLPSPPAPPPVPHAAAEGEGGGVVTRSISWGRKGSRLGGGSRTQEEKENARGGAFVEQGGSRGEGHPAEVERHSARLSSGGTPAAVKRTFSWGRRSKE